MHHLNIHIARDARSEYELEFNVMILSVFASHSLRFIFRTDAGKRTKNTHKNKRANERTSKGGRAHFTHEAHALPFSLACSHT